MGLSFSEFKEYVFQREFNNYRTYLPVINSLNEFYEEDEVKHFYAKNIFNDKPTELIFFLEKGYLLVNFVEDKIQLEQNNCKLVKKTLISPISNYGVYELKLTFDNGNEMIFKNLEDSNESWHEEYMSTIRELYKSL